MRIKDILKAETEPVTIDADQTVHDAMCLMNKHRIGALVVTDARATAGDADPNSSHSHLRYSWGGTTASAIISSEICGVVTERDILHECGERCTRLTEPAPGEDACPSRVRDVMTTEEHLVVGVPDDDLEYAMRVMTKRNIRHLPILDGAQLAGMISIGDVLSAHLHLLHSELDTKDFEIRMLQDYVQGRLY